MLWIVVFGISIVGGFFIRHLNKKREMQNRKILNDARREMMLQDIQPKKKK